MINIHERLYKNLGLTVHMVWETTLGFGKLRYLNCVSKTFEMVTRVRNIWVFSPLVPSKREKNILVLLSVYIF